MIYGISYGFGDISDETWFAVMCAIWHMGVNYATDLDQERFNVACRYIVWG